MEKEIKFGERIIIISYRGKYNKEIAEFFVIIVKKIEKQLTKIMNKCGIPKEIHLNFKRGSGGLDGIYYVQKKNIAKHLIIIGVFTDGIKLGKKKDELFKLETNLIDTFVHELVHHKYTKERETREKTKKIAEKLVNKFLKR